MKNYLLWWLLILWVFSPLFVMGADWWSEWHLISSNGTIAKVWCTSVLDSATCDYTWPSIVLRAWDDYEYSFGDTFWAWSQDRRLKNFCARFQEPASFWDYNGWANPTFSRTSEIANNWYRVYKNTSMNVIKSNSIYQVKNHPNVRSSDNLFIKYVIEYANDEAATTRYHHTECFPYEISRCGDGVVDKDWFKKSASDPAEECDYNDTSRTWRKDWSGKTCNQSCKLVDITPVCNSTYNGKTQYTSSSAQWLKSTDNLCSEGSVTEFTYSGTPRIYTWKCKNWTTSKSCSATQTRCWDWVKNGSEACDEWSKNGTSSSTCSATCTTVSSVSCGTNNGWSKYFASKQTTPWLTKTSAWMCAAGLTVWAPSIVWTDSHLEWTCSNVNWASTTCKAYQQYCWDWVKNGSEECDWTDGCDSLCNIITHSDECDQTFSWRLRLWDNKPFTDTFNAGWHDRYLFDYDVYFEENYWDHNNGKNPTFSWTSQLVNNWKKVSANDSVVAIESTPYNIVSVPTRRAQNNVYIEYTIWYDNVAHSTTPSKSNLYSHKECASYEISRCGDGILDAEYNEECDPGSEWTKVMSDWRICNSECKLVTVPTPVCNSDYNGQRVSNLVNGSYLCREWEVWGFNYDESTHKWTWTCSNVAWSVDCRAIKPYCGDGILDSWEKCDPADESHTNWWNGWCSATCEPITVADGNLVIEKTLVWSKEITNTWDVITWNIKVTAVDGDVTNFTITDKLPDVLEYDSYTVKHSGWVTVGKPTVNWNEVSWKVTWTLKKWEYVEIELKTKARWMPKVDYVNVACVRPESNPEAEDCDDVEIPVDGKLVIEKTLVWSKEVKNTWDVITWNIKVSAVDGNVTNFTITDKMPSILWYKDSFVLHNPWLTIWTPVISWNEVSWKVTWTLEKWEYVEIQLTTYAKVMPDQDYDNVACVKYVGEDGKEIEDCDDEPLPAPHIWIKKHFTDWTKEKTVKIWDLIWYRIDFGNTGNASATVTSIKDFLPKNVEYVTGAIFIEGKSDHTNTTWWETIDILRWVHYNRTVDGVYIDIYGWITLTPNSTWYIILTWRVLGEYTWNRTNFACIYLNDKKVDCDDAHHNITDELMCKKLDITTRSFGSAWWSTNVSCSTDGWQAELIELDCGNGTVITWSNISVLPWICSYPSNSSSSSKSYTVQCKVDGKTNNDCKSSVSVQWQWGDGSTDPYCTKPTVTWSDRVKTVVCETDNGRSGEIKIDCGYWNQVYTSNWKVNSFTWTCNYTNAGYGTYKIRCRVDNRDIRESECTNEVKYTQPWWPSWGWWCSDCGERIEKILSPMKCFNINAGNASVEVWEILPFYWNIEKLDENKVEDLRYVEGGNKKYGEQMYNNLLGTSCDRFGDIALNSMMCYASVVDWFNNAIVKEKKFACLDSQNASKDKIINAWINWQSCKYNGCKTMQAYDPVNGTAYTFRSNAQIIEKLWEGVANLNLWEYYIWLDRVEYLYCDWEMWTKWEAVNTTCKSNFVLTSPYTVQKTPSWNLEASTETLGRFKPQVWGKIFSDYINAISTSAYSKNTAVQTAMDNFIKKYEKLAVKVNTNKFWSNVVVKKVPWKNIYFLSGDATFKESSSDSNPFTIVQTKGDVTINGNVQHNMMLLTKNNITFKWKCTSDQVVKWIFYAWWKLYREWANNKESVEKNKSKDNDYWCDAWWLHVKWVLIWDNFDELMKSSRSHINDWRTSNGQRYGEPDLKSKVMNWASVLIEYSPSVFTKSTMPPGAEDFTTALSIYKQ